MPAAKCQAHDLLSSCSVVETMALDRLVSLNETQEAGPFVVDRVVSCRLVSVRPPKRKSCVYLLGAARSSIALLSRQTGTGEAGTRRRLGLLPFAVREGT